MEAQSQGLACVATSVSGIGELIQPDRTGLLVAPDSPEELAAALQALVTDPARRSALGAAGRGRVSAEFALEANLERLARRFGLAGAE